MRPLLAWVLVSNLISLVAAEPDSAEHFALPPPAAEASLPGEGALRRYDPAVGDPDGGVAPGTLFENIPEEWVCPVCGMDKTSFERL